PSSRIRVARDEAGRVVGFSTVLPVCRESLQILELNPGIAALLRTQQLHPGMATLAATAEATNCFNLCHVVQSKESTGHVRAALLRDFSGLFAIGGTYHCSTVLPSYKGLLEACGFERVPAARLPRHPAALAYGWFQPQADRAKSGRISHDALPVAKAWHPRLG